MVGQGVHQTHQEEVRILVDSLRVEDQEGRLEDQAVLHPLGVLRVDRGGSHPSEVLQVDRGLTMGLLLEDQAVLHPLEVMRVDRGLTMGPLQGDQEVQTVALLFRLQMHPPNFPVAQEELVPSPHWQPLDAPILWRIYPQSRQGHRPP